MKEETSTGRQRNKTIPVDVEVNTREIKQTCAEALLNDMREDFDGIKFRVTDAEIVQAGTSELNTEEVRQILTAQNCGFKNSYFGLYQKNI